MDNSANITTATPSPYGTSRWRWLKPVAQALLLFFIDGLMIGQGIISGLIGAGLVFIYLPLTLQKRYRGFRKERLARFAIYYAAVVAAIALVAHDISLARERAETLITAVSKYKEKHGRYPDKLEQLVPELVPEILPPKRSLVSSRWYYLASDERHSLMYVAVPPFERRSYNFESGQWHDID